MRVCWVRETQVSKTRPGPPARRVAPDAVGQVTGKFGTEQVPQGLKARHISSRLWPVGNMRTLDDATSIIPPKIPYRFPQYASSWPISGAFPQRAHVSRLPGLLPAFVPTAANVTFSAPCRSTLCAQAPPFKRLRRSSGYAALPQGPSLRSGFVVPIHHHLFGPIRPTRRHSAISLLCSLYALPSLCVAA